MLDGTLQVESFTYRVSGNSKSNAYQKSAHFYYDSLLIGNLSFESDAYYKVPNRNRMTFRLEKALFYGKRDWTKILLLLLDELNIKDYTISRLDIAVDVDWGVLARYHNLYLDTNWRRASKSKKKPNMHIEPEDGRLSSLRIDLDARRKNIVIYEKDSSPQLYRQEDKQTPISYKEIQPYQINYWSANGLDTQLIERVEIRMSSKYTQAIRLHTLRKKEVLLTKFNIELGRHLSFRSNIYKDKNVSRIPMIDAFPVNELLIENKRVSAKRVYKFHLPADIEMLIKREFYAEKVKVVKSISDKIGVVDIGDGLEVKVWLRRKNHPLGRFHWKTLFTQKAIDATGRYPEYDPDINKITREHFEKYGEPNSKPKRPIKK